MRGVKLTNKPMQATLPSGAKPPGLRAGVQQAIAAAGNDSVTAVELELLSILDGPSFRGSPRSRVFLQFVVEETLAGRQDSLKERTVGIAVLGKRAEYDTGADSGVRVRANDVRKRLAAHYDAVGAAEPAFASNCRPERTRPDSLRRLRRRPRRRGKTISPRPCCFGS